MTLEIIAYINLLKTYSPPLATIASQLSISFSLREDLTSKVRRVIKEDSLKINAVNVARSGE